MTDEEILMEYIKSFPEFSKWLRRRKRQEPSAFDRLLPLALAAVWFIFGFCAALVFLSFAKLR